MAQFRQSGNFINGVIRNGAAASDHHHQQQQQVSIAIRSSTSHKHHQQSRPHHHRRLKSGQRKISITVLIIFLLIAFISAVIAFLYLSSHNKENSNNHTLDDELENDTDFLKNVTRIKRPKVLKFGHGSIILGKDSRYWDKDDRRRDEDYNEEDSEKVQENVTDNNHIPVKVKINSKIFRKNSGLYNEVGRDELKRYEAEYVASLMSIGKSKDHKSDSNDEDMQNVDVDDEYDDGIDGGESSSSSGTNMQNIEETDESFVDKVDVKHESLLNVESGKILSSNKRIGSRKKSKRHSGSCEMKILNSSALLIEPLESRKFTRFTLQYTQTEEKPNENKNQQWYPKFAGHQTLQEREQSFIAHDQTLNCGFIKGPNNYPSTGLDLLEDDAKYISTCHIAVSSCIFGNSDRLRPPAGKTFSKLSKKNVCFVMFMDEITLQTLNSEGQIMDRMGFIGLWKIIVVKNLPYSDMRRVGKIPKFLSHRLFPSARYSIWLDSKLRLQLDPFLILEYFLWRKGYEYAISNHYDRHCVWEEVIQNKKLNKYNHTIIDQQFLFYQADGLTKYNPLDPNKMLPSNVPEGSIIVRAHTPMSNLFSCLWFNEVERFTPRDQLSFAYTYYKFTKMNPEKPFYLNMFKDCERRKIAKLYHHRAQDKRNIVQHDIE